MSTIADRPMSDVRCPMSSGAVAHPEDGVQSDLHRLWMLIAMRRDPLLNSGATSDIGHRTSDQGQSNA